MSDYIKREDALRAFNGSCSTVDADDILRHLHKSIDVIKNIPPADAVEVVRCKDCVMCVEYMGDMFCGYQSYLANPAGVSADDYCSKGERAEA